MHCSVRETKWSPGKRYPQESKRSCTWFFFFGSRVCFALWIGEKNPLFIPPGVFASTHSNKTSSVSPKVSEWLKCSKLYPFFKIKIKYYLLPEAVLNLISQTNLTYYCDPRAFCLHVSLKLYKTLPSVVFSLFQISLSHFTVVFRASIRKTLLSVFC